MPVYDWEEGGSFEVIADWDGGAGATVPTIDLLYLHASSTSMLYHAEGTTGESTPVDVIYNLVDESGNRIVDEAANQIVVHDSENAILFHAKETDTLFHAEA